MAPNQLMGLIEAAVDALKADKIVPPVSGTKIEITRTTRVDFGDFTTNIALVLSKPAKSQPRQLAQLLQERIPESDLISRIEVAGPGFINFFLSDVWRHEALWQIHEKKDAYGRSTLAEPQKVQVEFVSANPTGPLHVGSGRNAAYGNALANLLEATGYEVQREFYVNDAGLQMLRFARSLQARYLQALGRTAEMPEDGYQGEYLIALGSRLATEKAEQWVDDIEAIKRWGIDRVIEQHRQSLERFGVAFDNWFSETSLHTSGEVQMALQRLDGAGYLYEKEGATWFRATELGAPRDQVVIRSGEDASPTYLGVDAAYLIDKHNRGFDKVIYVWGADHHGNVAGLKAVARALGMDGLVEVSLHQMVNLVADGAALRISRRQGNIVTLDELLDEVGPDAAKFNFLSRSIDMTIDFDLAAAKAESPENPVYYVQYQHARACSIIRGSNDPSREPLPNLAVLVHPSEMNLLRALTAFPEIVQEAAALRAPHRLTNFAQMLASEFSSFYRDCRVMVDDAELSRSRLFLVDCARQVMSNALGLLGVAAPEQM